MTDTDEVRPRMIPLQRGFRTIVDAAALHADKEEE